jgi:hypothetical protein
MITIEIERLKPEIEEWAASHPGGVTAFVEELLQQAFQKEHGGHATALASESTLAKIWDTPEEDAAWADL